MLKREDESKLQSMYDIFIVLKLYLWSVGCKFIDGSLGSLFAASGWLKTFGAPSLLLNVSCTAIYKKNQSFLRKNKEKSTIKSRIF